MLVRRIKKRFHFRNEFAVFSDAVHQIDGRGEREEGSGEGRKGVGGFEGYDKVESCMAICDVFYWMHSMLNQKLGGGKKGGRKRVLGESVGGFEGNDEVERRATIRDAFYWMHSVLNNY